MIEPGIAEQAAQAVDNAWAIKYGNARGSLEAAATLLTWLDDKVLKEESPLYQTLEAAAMNGETPVAVSTCDVYEAMRWYQREEFVFAYDTKHRLFLFRPADLKAMPEVRLEAVRAE
jgi:hypothetical protein